MRLALPPDLMVSVSGFRGRVGESLTPELVAGLGAAFGTFLRRSSGDGPVAVGRDSRTSGEMLAAAVASGLRSVGCDVVELGMVATPTLMLFVEDTDAVGGIGVTASHNPAEWNALKFAGAEGTFLDAEAMGAFQRLVREGERDRAAWDALGTRTVDEGATTRHLQRILALDLVDIAGLRERGFHVALDCVHGAGSPIMLPLLEALGCGVSAIGAEPDGRFPRDPEPVADNLADLGALVVRTGADVGFAVDPDVDRLSVVDEAGRPLGEDLTLALSADVVLARQPGVVVTNLSTSQVVDDVAKAHGSRVVRAPVGEINVARRMQAEGSVIGGEGNGGVILPALHHTRDAPLAATLVLQHLLDHGGSASQVRARWPEYRIVKRKARFAREVLDRAYDALDRELHAPERDTTDGLRMAWADRAAWLHVRPSGTEPVIRLIAEAPTEKEALALLERAEACLRDVT